MDSADISGLRIEFFTSPTCVRCPRVKQMLEQLLGERGLDFNQVVKIRNTGDDPDAMTDMMMLNSYSTPTVKINDKVLIGDITEAQLREALGMEVNGGR